MLLISEMSVGVINLICGCVLMDRLVLIFSGGMVDDNGEFTSMRQQVARFDSPPTFEDIKTRVNYLFKVRNEGQ
jgi:hypothetical protein